MLQGGQLSAFQHFHSVVLTYVHALTSLTVRGDQMRSLASPQLPAADVAQVGPLGSGPVKAALLLGKQARKSPKLEANLELTAPKARRASVAGLPKGCGWAWGHCPQRAR